MPYDCPNCGALEGSRHRASCSLAGHEVAVQYGPPDYGPTIEWFEHHRTSLTEQAPGAYIAINIHDLTYAVGHTHEKAVTAYNKRNGSTPPGGRNFLGVRLAAAPA